MCIIERRGSETYVAVTYKKLIFKKKSEIMAEHSPNNVVIFPEACRYPEVKGTEHAEWSALYS